METKIKTKTLKAILTKNGNVNKNRYWICCKETGEKIEAFDNLANAVNCYNNWKKEIDEEEEGNNNHLPFYEIYDEVTKEIVW